MSETTTKCECAAVHVFPQAVENFRDATGIDLYDLPITWDKVKEEEAVTWETITPATDFAAAKRYLEKLAAEWLADGTASHYCG